MNLLTKLSEKFKNMSSETKKRIAATMLAGSMAFSGLGMAGCKPSNSTTNNNGSSIQTPGGDNGSNGGNQNSGNNGGSQNNKYANYSQILQNVLTDSYYYGLVGNAESMNDQYKYTNSNNNYEPIPYGFLEDQGFDVTKYKNNQLICYAYIFSIGNDLYVQLSAEIESSTNYNANYVLKYTLTDQELKELYSLHAPLFSNDGNATYFQAPFFVQELSYLKDPEILSISYATNACNLSANDYFDKKQFLSNYHVSTYIKSEPVENSQTCYHYFLIRPRITNSRSNSKVGVVKMHTGAYHSFYDGDRHIFNTSNLKEAGNISKDNRTKFEESITSVVAYNSANHHFKDLSTWDNWNNWENDYNANN